MAKNKRKGRQRSYKRQTGKRSTRKSINDLRGYREGVDASDVWNSFFYNWDSSQEISIESSNGNLKQTLRITEK